MVMLIAQQGSDRLASHPDPCAPNGSQKTKAGKLRRKGKQSHYFILDATQELLPGMCALLAPLASIVCHSRWS